MDPFRESLAKALTGEPGDKRNTKYALAGAGGYALGVNVGNQMGARLAGTTLKQNRAEALAAMRAHTDEAKAQLKANPLPQETRKERKARKANNKAYVKGKGGRYIPTPHIPTYKDYEPSLRTVNRINNSVKGTKSIHRGGEAGAVMGAATGLAAYGAYRAHKRGESAAITKYWEGTPKPEHRKISFTDAALGAGTGMALGGAAAYALTRGKVKIKRVKVPGKTKIQTKIKEVPAKAPKVKVVNYRRKNPENYVPGDRWHAEHRPPTPEEAAEARKISVTQAPNPGRTSTKDNPVGPNVPKSTAAQAAASVRAGQIRANQARLLRRKAAADKSKAMEAAEVARLDNPNRPPVTADGTPVAMPKGQEARARRRANAQIHGKPGKHPRKVEKGLRMALKASKATRQAKHLNEAWKVNHAVAEGMVLPKKGGLQTGGSLRALGYQPPVPWKPIVKALSGKELSLALKQSKDYGRRAARYAKKPDAASKVRFVALKDAGYKAKHRLGGLEVVD